MTELKSDAAAGRKLVIPLSLVIVVPTVVPWILVIGLLCLRSVTPQINKLVSHAFGLVFGLVQERTVKH